MRSVHFTEEQTGRREGQSLAWNHSASKWWGQDLNPHSTAPESVLEGAP